MNLENRILVNKPWLPELDSYNSLLESVWSSNILTNNGPYLRKLEKELSSLLKVDNLVFVSNGTIALQIAIKALDLKGEIITTPFTYIATTSSIVWENCTPVFVDVEADTFNIDAELIEESITEKTVAILATHVYGNPCDVNAIQKIAEKHNLKVVYDAAHAFGVEIYGRSIFEYGDISTCSTHATKIFSTIEGGFLVANDTALVDNFKWMRNFGHNGPFVFETVGINGKNSEFHAAFGLLSVRHWDEIFHKRKQLNDWYDQYLSFEGLRKPRWSKQSVKTYSYYPVVLETEKALLEVEHKLEEANIGTRRYFYPPLSSNLPYVNIQKLPVVDSLSDKVLCLPFYVGLREEDVRRISEIINNTLSA